MCTQSPTTTAVRQIPLLLRYDSVGCRPGVAGGTTQPAPGPDDLRALDASEGLRLGGLNIPTNAGVAAPSLAGVRRQRRHIPNALAASVLDGTAPPSSPAGKIVLVGEMTDAPALPQRGWKSVLVHPVEVIAQAVSSMRLGLGWSNQAGPCRSPGWC